jgi:cell division protein FtsL
VSAEGSKRWAKRLRKNLLRLRLPKSLRILAADPRNLGRFDSKRVSKGDASMKKREINGITGGMVSVILITMTIALILGLFKIYLSNRIYFESRKLNKLYREVEMLKAEHRILKQKIEALNFKQQIADTIFTIDDGTKR